MMLSSGHKYEITVLDHFSSVKLAKIKYQHICQKYKLVQPAEDNLTLSLKITNAYVSFDLAIWQTGICKKICCSLICNS